MGHLLNGKWLTGDIVTSDTKGSFVRKDSVFRDYITRDGSSGFTAEPQRYHVYYSYACPWASRVLIFLNLKGLNNIISSSCVEPYMQENGWDFGEAETKDPLFAYKYLYEIYQRADSNYSGKATVPVLWDKKKNTIVNNESSEIIRMLNSEFNEFTNKAEDYYPQDLRQQIDDINTYVYNNINNGVYRCGFAKSQASYEQAFDALFTALEEIDKRLNHSRYLVGDKITEADWRLFTTLIRFDAVYYVHFKCNLKRIEEYNNLPNYLRELYQIPGIKETVNFEHIKKHYYLSHTFINPLQIIPRGPILNYDRSHNRQRLVTG